MFYARAKRDSILSCYSAAKSLPSLNEVFNYELPDDDERLRQKF
jgi:hypothetical protein